MTAFEWLQGGTEKKKSWCDTCQEETKNHDDHGFVRCKECMHLKGVISG